ncbi:Helicase associated domain protein [Streptomyces sp. NPDC054794]
MKLRPHQREAVDALVRALDLPAGAALPPGGLRTQVVMATGSGKTLVAVRGAEELRAGRVLVLVPSLDLLAQTEEAWRAGGRTGPMIGVSSLRGDQAAFPNTTSVDELVAWVRPFDKVTVLATYASLGLGTLERAHAAGLPGWDLIVVDEAHRTSGRIGKPWAVVHDNARIPSLRRLYMTATPRLWQPEEDQRQEPGAPGELVASMDDDPDGPFGTRCHTLTLSEAIDRGICAPYQVVCVDVTDTQLQAAQLLGMEGRTDEVRGARLAALQTALVKAAGAEGLRRTLVFHHLVREAEAFAAGLPAVAAQLHAADPGRYPEAVWADWLCGDHAPAHRRRVLHAFAHHGGPAEQAFLSSVKVLGEGVDTKHCDSVYFADVRGSMPDLVQAVGRALRIRPGEGKTASLVVPVLLGPGETPDTMLTSRAYAGLARLLEALRAHDARIVERLAEPQAPSRSPKGRVLGERGEEHGGELPGVSAPAQALLRFSTPRDPALLAAFIELRVINPERAHWRRGVEAAALYTRVHGDLRVPFTFRVPGGEEAEGEGWPGALAGFPLGQWIADARRLRTRGSLDDDRARQLDELGMVWSHFDLSWEEGLAAARAWAAEHGHLLAPHDATHQGFRLGIWLKNQRAAARRAAGSADDAMAEEAAGALSEERRELLDEIDPAWCPAWPVEWQRRFHLTRLHLEDGGALPTEPGDTVRQGEDLGRWVRAQRLGWDGLAVGQQWLCEHVLGIEPAAEAELPRPRVSHADKWAVALAAAAQFYEREGHLSVPRKHVESVVVGAGADRERRQIKLGAWISNQRVRASSLTSERKRQLSDLGMRWA